MRVLDLFSGIGGFSLGLERAGMETVAFCEFDKKAQLVLKKHWPDVPIYNDVRELNGKQIREEIGAVQIICGGFPCQPFSQAGKRKGEEDDRHLWPEYFRLIQEIRPRWVIGENVAGLISMGLDEVLSDLESENYSCQTLVIPACAVNAPHRRDRVWIVGYTEQDGSSTAEKSRISGSPSTRSSKRENKTIKSQRTGRRENNGNVAHTVSNSERSPYRERTFGPSDNKQNNWDKVWNDSRNCCKTMANSTGEGWERRLHRGQNQKRESQQGYSGCGSTVRIKQEQNWWAVEPDVGRVAHGIPRRVDRLKQLGNAVVPQVVEQIGRAIMGIENESE